MSACRELLCRTYVSPCCGKDLRSIAPHACGPGRACGPETPPTCCRGTLHLQVATATCASNIAVIKYWGKRDSKLVLPINSSLSVTLDPDRMGTTTTAAVVTTHPNRCPLLAHKGAVNSRTMQRSRTRIVKTRLNPEQVSPDWEGDRLWLNGKEEDVNAQRIQNCLREIRKRAGSLSLSPPSLSCACVCGVWCMCAQGPIILKGLRVCV